MAFRRSSSPLLHGPETPLRSLPLALSSMANRYQTPRPLTAIQEGNGFTRTQQGRIAYK
jgi:hypothetical protein